MSDAVSTLGTMNHACSFEERRSVYLAHLDIHSYILLNHYL